MNPERRITNGDRDDCDRTESVATVVTAANVHSGSEAAPISDGAATVPERLSAPEQRSPRVIQKPHCGLIRLRGFGEHVVGTGDHPNDVADPDLSAGGNLLVDATAAVVRGARCRRRV